MARSMQDADGVGFQIHDSLDSLGNSPQSQASDGLEP